jgi:glycerophosphoryl diester phosphodiesterase
MMWRMATARRAIRAAVLAAIGAALTVPAAAYATTGTSACPAPAAHRGGDYYTQSTARNFTASARAGAKVWETDVRFDRTGYPFLLHDPDLGIFGAPKLNITDATGAQIAALKATDGSTVETVWQLGQQLLATPGQRALMELKVTPTTAQWATFAARVKPLGPRVWVASFDSKVTAAARARGYQSAQIDPHASTRTASAVAALGTAYESEWSRLTRTYVTQLHAAGVTVYAWTADTPTEWAHVQSVGAVPITDDPSGYFAWARSGCGA